MDTLHFKRINNFFIWKGYLDTLYTLKDKHKTVCKAWYLYVNRKDILIYFVVYVQNIYGIT